MYKIIASDQKEYGPVSADEVRQWIAEGRANGQTPVQMIGNPDWRPLALYPEFAAALAASPFATQPGFSASTNAGTAPTTQEILARDYDLDLMGCLTRSWELVKGNLFPVVGISFLVTVVISVVNQVISLIYRVPMQSMITNHEVTVQGVGLICFGMLLGMPIQTVLMGGLYNYYLKLIRREDTSIADAFSGFSSSFGQLALTGFVVGIFTLIGTACCLIPGIYLSVAWIFSIPLVIDKKIGFWEAMELSRKVVTRHWFMVFVLLVLVGLVSACGIIACCVGVFVTAPIGWIAMMYAYEDLFTRRTQ